MRTFEFVGDRGDFRGRTLSRGDRMELTDDDARYLVVDQGFPITELVEAVEAVEVVESVPDTGTKGAE